MEVNSSFPAKSVPEFIAFAKANPGKINMASAGLGSGPHVAGELFKMMASVNIVHVPYRGSGPALTDLIGGQVQMYFDGIPTSIEHIRSGKLRALAVTSDSRSEVLPDIPTLSDFLPGFEASFWVELGCAQTHLLRLSISSIKKSMLALPIRRIRARLADLGGTPLPGSPADFGKLIADETEKWAKVVKFAGIRAE